MAQATPAGSARPGASLAACTQPGVPPTAHGASATASLRRVAGSGHLPSSDVLKGAASCLGRCPRPPSRARHQPRLSSHLAVVAPALNAFDPSVLRSVRASDPESRAPPGSPAAAPPTTSVLGRSPSRIFVAVNGHESDQVLPELRAGRSGYDEHAVFTQCGSFPTASSSGSCPRQKSVPAPEGRWPW